MRGKRDTRKALIEDAHRGGVTLFLGAGVSIGRGIPGWQSLVSAIWREVYSGNRKEAIPPWERDGVSMDHPLSLQIALEDIEVHLRPGRKAAHDAIGEGQAALVKILHEHLYRNLREDPGGSLSSIVRIIRQDQKRAKRRIRRVITLNADDLLEEQANEGHHPESAPVVWPISRASFHPRRGTCAHGRPPISVYHIHGYLPRRPGRGASDTLVFTDQQYWESVASPVSFANRVVINALHDSNCLFIGMSMTDVNLMRWLGTQGLEIENDKRSQVYLEAQKLEALGQLEEARKKMQGTPRRIRDTLRRHYWVCRDGDDPTQLLSRHLDRRGVRAVPIPDWNEGLRALLKNCFSDRCA